MPRNTGADTMEGKPILWTGKEIAEALAIQWPCRAGGAVRATGLNHSNWYEPGDAVYTQGGPPTQRAVLAGGAAAVLAQRADPEIIRSYPVLEVGVLSEALWKLAKVARKRFRGRVVAITGSVGKSWTKESLAHALKRQGVTSATLGNLNSREGVGHTVAATPRNGDFGVYEVGMGDPGSVLELARLARPHVAVITTIAQSHLPRHQSIDSIVETKAAIYQTLEPGGVAVLPRDSEHYPRLRAAARDAGAARRLSFGRHDDADVRLVDAALSATGSDVTAEFMGEQCRYRLRQAGRHLVIDSLAVLAAAAAVGANWKRAAQDMAGARFMVRRGSPASLKIRGGTIAVLDDTYNANPVSMRAAIETLGLHAPTSGGSRVAVLADMLGMVGEIGARAHVELVGPLKAAGVALVFTMGEMMVHLHQSLPAELRGRHCASPNELCNAILERLQPGDVVLFKGSGDTQIHRAVELLCAAVGSKLEQWA
jgi:UDP-N-acetylmuramoyl-tripeptide--D-alanyl-D-alanine ligase